MKYPKIKAEWEPISNLHVNVTSQELKIYVNGSLKEQRVFDRWAREHEFFIPAWDSKGNLLEELTRVYFTVEAKTDNFSSEVTTSNVIQLESISIKEKPTDLKVSVMPFPRFYQEFDSPVFVVGSGVN